MNAFQELEAELLTGRRELRDLVAARGATHDRQTRDLLNEQIDALTSDARRLETSLEEMQLRRLDALLDDLEREQQAQPWLVDGEALLDLLFGATNEQRKSNNEGHQKGAKRVPAAKKKRWSPPDLMNPFERNDS